MKVKLISLAALIILSAISSIFNAMPLIGASAQDYETVDDYDSSYGNNNYNEEMVESYSYEEPNTYNTDDGYNNFDPSTYGQNSEYSSYNSYGPPTLDYGDGNAEEYSSYDNSYSSDDPGLYGNQYNNYYEEEGSYDSSYYPPKKPQKFTCPDSGLVVDKPESCPIICPVESTLAGHFVAAGSNLTQICNVDKQVLETCGLDTDLPGVFVTDATPEQCNIFAICDFRTPLGEALGLNSTQTVEVADVQLCELEIPDVPPAIDLAVCPARSPENPNVNPDLAGALVTDEKLCEAPTALNICPEDTDLAGVYANITETDTTACDLADADIVPIQNNTNAQCIKCADLAVFQALISVTEGAPPVTSFPQREASSDLIGTPNNVFTVCNAETDAEQISRFNALVDITSTTQEGLIRTGFSTCVTNAPTQPPPGLLSQDVVQSLQENSLTTNVKPQAEIPTVSESVQALESALQENSVTTNVKPEAETSTFDEKMSPPPFFPPKIAQGIEDSSASSDAVEKTTKLKQQWLDLLQ
jgi:hypothetical protein